MTRGTIATAGMVAAGIMFSSFAAAQLAKAPKVEFTAAGKDQSATHCLLDRHFVLALPAGSVATFAIGCRTSGQVQPARSISQQLRIPPR